MTTSASSRAVRDVYRRRVWVVAILALVVVVVVWPLQALALAMLATTALMVMSVYGAFTEHDVVHGDVRARLDRALPAGLGVVLAVGAAATLAWPALLTPVVFLLLVTSCVAWLVSEGVLARRDHAGRAVGHGRRS